MTTKMVALGLRVPEPIRDALSRAAADELRSASGQVELILSAWLRERGYLGEPPKGGPTHRRNRPQPKLPKVKAAEAAPAPTPREEPAGPAPAAVARERPQRRRYRDAPR